MKKKNPAAQAKKLNTNPVIVINLSGNLECFITPSIVASIEAIASA